MKTSYFLGCSFGEMIIRFSSGDVNQYVLSFLLYRFEYKNNLSLDHKQPSDSSQEIKQ